MTMAAQVNDRMDGGYKPMPLWLSIPLLLVCLGAGFYIIRWYFNSAAVVKETSILGVAPPDGRTRYLEPNNKDKPTSWAGRTELAQVELKVDKGAVTFGSMSFNQQNYRPLAFIPDNNRKILEGAGIAYRTKKIGTTTLNDDTIKALRNQSQWNETVIQPGDTDKMRLVNDLDAYLKASEDAKITAEIQFLNTVDDVAKANEEATKQNVQQRVDAISKVLSAEEVAELPKLIMQNPRGGGPGGGGPGGGRTRPGP